MTRMLKRKTWVILLITFVLVGCGEILAEQKTERIQRIEFITEERNNQALTWEQYIVNSDGSDQINLNRSLDFGIDNNTVDLLWEPNGEKVAFVRKAGERFRAYVSNPDGSDFVELGATLSGSNVVLEWSPNGESLIIGNIPGNDLEDIADVYVVTKDNSTLTKIITNIDVYSSPTWSPDGKHILVHGRTSAGMGIFLFNPDGTGGKNLISDWDYANSPVWSPNSKSIIFQTGDENSVYLYMVDIESAFQVELLSMDQNTSLIYEWSDNSQYIAVQIFVTDFDKDINYSELYLVDVERGEPTPILTGLNTTQISYMYWIKNDDYFTFNAYVNGNGDIYRVNAKTRVLENLTQTLSDENNPIPSPDGKQIAFVTNVTGDQQIHILDLDDNSTFKLTSNSGGREVSYRWSSNSKYLAYSSNVSGTFQVFAIDVSEQDRSPLQLSNTEVDAFVQDWVP